MIDITPELFIFKPYKEISHTTITLNVLLDYRKHGILFIYYNYYILNIPFV